MRYTVIEIGLKKILAAVTSPEAAQAVCNLYGYAVELRTLETKTLPSGVHTSLLDVTILKPQCKVIPCRKFNMDRSPI